MTEHAQQTAPDVRDFAAWLLEHDAGETVKIASRALAETAAAAMAQGKKATLTLKIAISPAGSTNAATVQVSVSQTLPQPEPAASIFFADDAGNLTRDDPKQIRFDVDPHTGEVR